MVHRPCTAATTLAAVVLLLAAAVAGCSKSDRPPPTPPAPPTVPSIPRLADRNTEPPPSVAAPYASPTDAGPRYALPARLCPAVDLTALQDLFPLREERPLADLPGLCDTAARNPTMAVSISVNAQMFNNTGIAWAYYTTARRLARSTPTDIPGAGTAAFFTGGPTKIELVTYHGNLALHVTCATITDRQHLPNDTPARLARIAANMYTKLTP